MKRRREIFDGIKKSRIRRQLAVEYVDSLADNKLDDILAIFEESITKRGSVFLIAYTLYHKRGAKEIKHLYIEKPADYNSLKWVEEQCLLELLVEKYLNFKARAYTCISMSKMREISGGCAEKIEYNGEWNKFISTTVMRIKKETITSLFGIKIK